MEHSYLTCAIALSRIFAYKCAAGRRLLETMGGYENVFAAGEKKLRETMPSGEVWIKQIVDADTLRRAQEEYRWATANGVRLLTIDDAGYPGRMLECEDAPLILYCKGAADLNAGRSLAVVGTRKCSWYGKTVCSEIISGLSQNSVKPMIISGLAFGIDASAHRAALECGLTTVAVMPTGPDSIYPAAHLDLAKRILDSGGALVTDFAKGTMPQISQFLRRNRIIAAMSDATLVIESFAKGGSLITAGLANSYDREVFAVPGRLKDPSYEGCNRLIEKNMARLATDFSTIEQTMGWSEPLPHKDQSARIVFPDNPAQAAVMKIISERGQVTFNDIFDLCGKDITRQELSATLLSLEIDSRIALTPGNRYELTYRR